MILRFRLGRDVSRQSIEREVRSLAEKQRYLLQQRFELENGISGLERSVSEIIVVKREAQLALENVEVEKKNTGSEFREFLDREQTLSGELEAVRDNMVQIISRVERLSFHYQLLKRFNPIFSTTAAAVGAEQVLCFDGISSLSTVGRLIFTDNFFIWEPERGDTKCLCVHYGDISGVEMVSNKAEFVVSVLIRSHHMDLFNQNYDFETSESGDVVLRFESIYGVIFEKLKEDLETRIASFSVKQKELQKHMNIAA